MLLKSCGRCKALIPYGHTYCTACEPIVQAEIQERKQLYKRRYDKAYNSKRDPKYIRFYNSNEWRVLSAKRLQDDGYKCCMCHEIATEADHIIPIQTEEGWMKRLDYDNTRSLCTTCHNKRHNRFISKQKRRTTS